MKLIDKLTGLLVLFCFFLLGNINAVSARTDRIQWVYMTPNETRILYSKNPIVFNALKTEVDAKYLPKISALEGCILTNSVYEVELRKGIEEMSAVYAGLHWYKYSGFSNPETDIYLNAIVRDWKSLIASAPAQMWDYNGANGCINNIGWREGDIALRAWIIGTIPSYDIIRNDIPSSDKKIIDDWMRTVAIKMMTTTSYPLWHNRGVSKSAQAHVIALVLQDSSLFSQFWNDPNLGMKNVIRLYNNQPKAGCDSDFSNRPGLSKEMSYKSGVYGRGSTSHAFQAMMSFAHTARNGGDPSIDPLNSADLELLNKIIDSHIAWGTTDRDKYLTYSACLDANWGYDITHQTKDADLSQNFWINWAYLNPTFQEINTWDATPLTRLWRFRANSILTNNF
jgi:hypothetical protein